MDRPLHRPLQKPLISQVTLDACISVVERVCLIDRSSQMAAGNRPLYRPLRATARIDKPMCSI
jgi:hypothetical protein